jgi:uncharacterized protein
LLGLPQLPVLHDTYGAILCLIGLIAQLFTGRRLRIPASLNYAAASFVALLFCLFGEQLIPPWWFPLPFRYTNDWVPGLILIWNLFTMTTAVLFLTLGRVPNFKPERRQFLRVSTATACAIPAVVFGGAIITRKDFKINEIDFMFPNLPKDLRGLRLLQISDIHIGAFFSCKDLARVVDASNGLKPDLTFITGDLITTAQDPLDACLLELSRLRSATGVWGCMGNHEMYAKAESYTKARAAELGMDFLRFERRTLSFGASRLNLLGIDFQHWWEAVDGLENLVSKDTFNLLLAHTPEVFPKVAGKGVQLTLSGHTHGGQINLELFGVNLNVVDLATKYTKGLYTVPGSSIYVNSGLGTIGVPMRIGAPAEISVIRLCNS